MTTPILIEKDKTSQKEADSQILRQNVQPEHQLPVKTRIPVVQEYNPPEPAAMTAPESSTVPTTELQENQLPEDSIIITNQPEPSPEEPVLRRSSRISRPPPHHQDFIKY